MIPNRRMNQTAQAYARNTSWLVSDRAFRLVSSVAINIWMARHFGPDLFGSFVYCIAIVAILGPFLQLGLRAPLTKRLASASDEESRLLIDNALGLRAAAAGLFFTLSLFYLFFLGASIPTEQRFLPILFAAQILFSTEVFAIRFDSVIESKVAARASIAQSLFSILSKGTLILMDAPLPYFFGTILFEYSVYAYTLSKLYRRRFHLPRITFNLSLCKSLLTEASPIIISGFSIMIYMKLDVIMLNRMIDSKASGTYAAAASLSECWYFLPTTISQALLPAILKAKQMGEEAYQSALSRLSSALIWLSVSIAIATTFLASFAVPTVFGEAYNAAITPLKIHIWAGIFASIGVANSGWFVTEGKQKLAALFTTVGAIANVALNYLLIPRYGTSGAAVATLAAYAIAAYFLLPLTAATRARFAQIARSAFRIPFPIGQKP